MGSRLIIIRGNSGSGKSTVAGELRLAMGYGTMLIPQDVIRREIMRVKDTVDNPAIQLIEDIALYGKHIGYDIIIEGILHNELYGNSLRSLCQKFDKSYAFYFDVSFEETLRRHKTKNNSHEFGEELMKKWWVDDDFLKVENEVVISSKMSKDETVQLILNTIEYGMN